MGDEMTVYKPMAAEELSEIQRSVQRNDTGAKERFLPDKDRPTVWANPTVRCLLADLKFWRKRWAEEHNQTEDHGAPGGCSSCAEARVILEG
jgi:hypothetical protein